MREEGRIPELLAPAGDLEGVRAALANGADAVYLGVGSFHARAKVGFGPEELRQAVVLARICGAKIYVTFNTLIADGELEEVLALSDQAVEAGADALIVQDLGLAVLFRRRYPGIALHASTQMGVHNVCGARMLKQLGFERAILARETPLPEIRRISREIETEVFVHGALCVCFSGSCFLSSSIFSASGNRGKCLQPCRRRYTLKQGERILKEGYLLSMADLCLQERLEELKEAGVRSLKIEGRLRRTEYVAGTVRAYRRALDGMPDPEDRISLKKLFNRGDFTVGHAFSAKTSELLSPDIQGHRGVFWGRVEKISGDRLQCGRRPNPGDAFKVLRRKGTGLTEAGSAVCDAGGRLLGSAGLRPGDLLYLTSDRKQLEELGSIQRPALDLTCTLAVGRPAALSLSLPLAKLPLSVRVEGGTVLPATGAGLSEEQIKTRICKLNETPFRPGEVHIEADAGVFLPVSALNSLRRSGVERLLKSLEEGFPAPAVCRTDPEKPASARKEASGPVLMFRPGTRLPEAGAAALVVKPFDLEGDPGLACPQKTFLFLPAYTSEADLQKAGDYLKKYGLGGIWANQFSQTLWAEEEGIPYFCGTGMNVFNGQTVAFFQRRPLCRGITLSNELNRRQLAALTGLDKVLLYAYGRPEAMTLRHCPVQQGYGNDCADCRFREGLSLTDEKGAVFPFSRMRMSDCTFFLHNSAVFSAFRVLKDIPCGVVLDFTLPGEIPPGQVLDFYRRLCAGEGPAWNWPATSGNLNRGV